MKGARYTCSSGQEDPCWITSWFPRIGKTILVKFSSLPCQIQSLDHMPIALKNDEWRKNPNPFHFVLMWLEFHDFKEKIQFWWDLFHLEGKADFILSKKLQALEAELSRWNKEVFRGVEKKVKCLKKINEID